MAEIQFLIHSNEVVIRIITETPECIHIHDEPIMCSACNEKIEEDNSPLIFKAIDKGLCIKCYTAEEKRIKSLTKKISTTKAKQEKLIKELTELEYQLFISKSI